MAENTKIQWAHHTFNPWRGCTKVAAGCANCYADTMSKRNPSTLGIWGPNGTRVMASEQGWREPVKWNEWARDGICHVCRGKKRISGGDGWFLDCEHCGATGRVEPYRARVFCASLADVFEEWDGPITNSNGEWWLQCDSCENPDGRLHRMTVKPFGFGHYYEHECGEHCRKLTLDDLRRDLFALIDATPHLDWLLVTKRPENIRRMWPKNSPERTAELWGKRTGIQGGGDASLCRPNVWLLTSIAEQADADKNIPELLKCRDLAPVLGVSAEPLIGPVCLDRFLGDAGECDICGPAPTEILLDDGTGTHEAFCVKCHEADPDAFSTITGCDPLLDWVIVGGESGHNVRPFVVEYGADIVRQCRAAGVPVFFKQMGSFVATTNANLHDFPEGTREAGWGQFAASCRYLLNDPKGGAMVEWPEELRVREFPRVAEVASSVFPPTFADRLAENLKVSDSQQQ